MSETSVGSIVGYLRLDNSAWNRDLAEAELRARRLGRVDPRIRIETNAGRVIGELELVSAAENRIGQSATRAKAPVIGLVGALAAIAPAAVPIAGVAGGAMLGLLPVAASLVLGIMGIVSAMKSGELEGTQYGRDIQKLQGFFGDLKQTAASGLLAGVDTAIRTTSPLFQTISTDVGIMSRQLGHITGSAAPALVAILTQLNPLFITFGELITNGTDRMLHWAQSTTGITSFVRYVQSALPSVMDSLGQTTTLISHLAQGAAPFGGSLLIGMTAFIRVLNAMPIGVLQVAIPLFTAGYVALKAYQGVTFIVASVNAALLSMGNALGVTGVRAEASAAIQAAAAAQVEAIYAEETVVITAAQAAQAAAAAESAVAIAASVEGTSSVLAAGAATAAEAAIEESAAFQAAANSAVVNSERMNAAAALAAQRAQAAGRAASIGWASMLGPVGAVAVGVGLLTMMMFRNKHQTEATTGATESYTQALLESKGAIDASVRAQVAKQLQDVGALDAARQLGIGLKSVTDAVVGNDTTTGKLITRVAALGAQYDSLPVEQQTDKTKALSAAADLLLGTLDAQHTEFKDGALAAQQEAAAIDGTSTAMTNAAYSTDKQTLAMQQANDAAGLLKQAFDALNGKTLDVNDANVAFHSALLNLDDALARNGTTMDLNAKAGVENNQAVSQAIRQAQAHAQAISGGTALTREGSLAYLADLQALKRHVEAVGGDTTAIDKLIESVNKIPPHRRTKIEIEKEKAAADARALKRELDAIDRVIRITAVITRQNNETRRATNFGPDGKPKATGGIVTGPGGPRDDKAGLFALSNGEFVNTAASTSRNRGALEAGNKGAKLAVVGYADGGIVGQVTTRPDPVTGKTVWVFDGTEYGSARAARNAQHAAQGRVQTNRDDVRSDFAPFLASLSGSARQIAQAEARLGRDVKAADASAHLQRILARENGELLRLAHTRGGIANRLKDANRALTDARKDYRDEQRQVAGTITGAFDIADSGSSATEILANLNDTLAASSRFSTQLAALRKRGLRKDLVAQLAEAGLAAEPSLQALAQASTGQIKSINAGTLHLATLGNSVGRQAAEALHRAGVDAAKGLVAGLKSQETQLERQMAHLGHVMVSQIRKELKIQSPSLIMRELGSHAGRGFAIGITDQHPAVRAASSGLADAALPTVRGGSRGMESTARVYVPITVNPSPSMDEEAVGVAAGRHVAARLGL